MLKKIGIVTSYLLLFSLLIYPISIIYGQEQQEPREEKITRLSIELLELVKRQQYGEAKQIIEEIAVLFPTIEYEGLTTVEGIEAISSTIIQVKGELAAIKPQYNTAIYHTTQLYLALDALFHPSQPIWNRYYFKINNDIQEIQRTIGAKEQQAFEEALQALQSHYLLIKPSLYVSKPPYILEKIDSLIVGISTQRDVDKELLVNQLKAEFELIFHGNEEEAFGNQIGRNTFWTTSFGMATVIFIVLSYVIWRKFKGEQVY